MSELERDLQQLHRYHDGELAGFERTLFERRLRRSEALQNELAALQNVSQWIERADFEDASLGGQSPASPDLWASIASALPAIDAQVEDERASATARPTPVPVARGSWFGLPGWVVGTGALAAAAIVALAVVIRLPGSETPEPIAQAVPAVVAPVVASNAGVVRYIDSGDASVMVIEDAAADMTIVWMMEAV